MKSEFTNRLGVSIAGVSVCALPDGLALEESISDCKFPGHRGAWLFLVHPAGFGHYSVPVDKTALRGPRKTDSSIGSHTLSAARYSRATSYAAMRWVAGSA